MHTTYLDNNATTRLDPRVLDAMLPLFTEHWGNAGSSHLVGRPVRKAVNEARRLVADLLGVAPADVIFTAGATEADNLALRGIMAAQPGGHLVTTAVEHSAVLDTARELQREGMCRLSVVGVDGEGHLDLDELREVIEPGVTRLVSVMAANNETGVLFPLEEVAALTHAAGALLHVDAVQVVGKSTVDLAATGADLLALSAHKFHGPKGVGVLTASPDARLRAQITGGGQEKNRRSGTENAPGIVGLARALELAMEEVAARVDHMEGLRARLEAGLTESIPGVRITGVTAPRNANTTHLTLPQVEAEPLLVRLDREGIACSAGSACSTGALEPSHVLVAMGVAPERLHGALRLSLSHETTAADIEHLLAVLPPAVARLRALTEPGI